MNENDIFKWFISNLKSLNVELKPETIKALKKNWRQENQGALSKLDEFAKKRGHDGFTIG